MDPAVQDAIAEALNDLSKNQRNQVKGEIKELPSVLDEKELPEKLLVGVLGIGTGLLVATNQRLVYINKRPLSSVQIEHYRYDDIISIESKTTSIFGGELGISFLGDLKHFSNIPKALTEPFAQHVRAKVPPENLRADAEEPEPQTVSETELVVRPELAEAIRTAVQEISPSFRKGIRKELDELPAILSDDELPEKMVRGWYNDGVGLLVATNKRLFFTDKRRFTGLQVEYFLYETINSVQARTGMMLGSIRIHTAGNIEVIDNVENDMVHPFAEFVRNKISAATSRANVAAPPTPAVSSLADELKKLAELVEMGILTKEEFDQQKAKMLGN